MITQPLSFDCQDNDLGFCQVLDKDALPKFQFPAYCETEITGGLEKLACEQLAVIENLSDVLTVLSGMLVSENEIRPDGSGTHSAKSEDYFSAGKSYLITFQVTNCTKGTYKIVAGDNQTDELGNGVHSVILNTGSGTDLEVVGTEEDSLIDGFVSNLSIQCLRYSELYTISGTDGYEFQTPTKVCKTGIDDSLTFERSLVGEVTEGKMYRLSFTITENTANSPGTEIAYGLGEPGALSAVQAANGFFQIPLECGSAPAKKIVITLPTEFDGCIQDITLYQQNEVRMGGYSKDRVEVSDPSVSVELVDDTAYLATLTAEDKGCFRLGYADACTDFMGQFTGRNIVDEFERELAGISLDGSEYVFAVGDTVYIIYRGIGFAGILFDLSLFLGFTDGIGNLIEITATLGGTEMTLQTFTSPPYAMGTAYEWPFKGICGTQNRDLVIQIVTGSAAAATQAFVILNDQSAYLGNPLSVSVDQDEAQFIPEKYSECLNVNDPNECKLVEIKYRNDTPVFGLDFGLEGYDYAKMWIPVNLWHPGYKKQREVYENTLGNRNVNYSDTDETYTMTTDYLPEYLIKALILAVDCSSFLINGEAFVCVSEEAAPTWNKSFSLGALELQFVRQNTRYLKMA